MKKSLDRIFRFLKDNRTYNKELQVRYYSSIVLPYSNTSKKVISILYSIANTQSQPRIDYLAEFYKKIYSRTGSLNSFNGFMSVIDPAKKFKRNYFGLFSAMRVQNGWGDKTSALLTKMIYHLHNEKYPKELKIWSDVPKELQEDDLLYLPVDAVIVTIFKHLDNRNWSFKEVNKMIGYYYTGNDIEVWDDLWFWGFVSQIGTGKNRRMGWNPNKYWTLRESDKNYTVMNEIQEKTKEFLSIL